MIRAVTFKSILDGVLRRCGLDPDAESLPHDVVRAVTEHINTRIETAWNYWPWRELMVTEERAYRPFWDETVAYVTDDEIYYPPEKAYYRAIDAVVAGTLPTDVTKFELMEVPLYGNIPFEQTGATVIGQVFGVYNLDPNLYGNPSARSIGFMQTENGVDVGLATGLSTVWLTFRIAAPIFTTVPEVEGGDYEVGDVAYFPEDGECKVAGPPDPGGSPGVTWALLPFPQMFAAYVKLGAFADTLLELDDETLSAEKVQMRLAKSGRAATQAEEMIGALCRRQIEQGERPRYRVFQQPMPRGWPVGMVAA